MNLDIGRLQRSDPGLRSRAVMPYNVCMPDTLMGLTSAEADKRREEYGPNVIKQKKPSPLGRLVTWVASPMSFMFAAAAGLSLWSGQDADAGIIAVLFLMNIGVGAWHEAKADTAIEELEKKLAVIVKAKRDGVWTHIPSAAIVPGDIVELSIGDLIPADITFMSAVNVSVNEAVITGESLPKQKSAGDGGYSGAYISTGLGQAIVTETGTHTYFGTTVSMVEAGHRASALEKDIISVSKFLSVVSIALMLVLSAVLFLAGKALTDIATLDVSMLIAGIPVALPTVMTLIISVGVVELARRNAIVRRLSSLEDLANVNLLLSDKTGTLTENRITVEKMVPLAAAGSQTAFMSEAEIWALATAAAPQVEENPLDEAINAKSRELSVPARAILDFIPGDSERKRTTIFFSDKGVRRAAALGAAETIAELSIMGDEVRRIYDSTVAQAAAEGFRVLALALSDNEKEERMRPLAVFFLADAVRAEAKDAVAFMNVHGIAVKMVTGDGRDVAAHVAHNLGIAGRIVGRAEFVDGRGLARSDFAGLAGFAEVMPKDKYDLVMMAKTATPPYVVAVTGDGVNDVPPVKAADVGIAVSNAVDALKGAADIVLSSTGIAVIKDAIVEARTIFVRLYNYSVYRISESFRLIVTIAVIGVIFGTYPLTPVQIILIALLNDVPIISLAYDRVAVPQAPASVNARRRFTLSTLFGSVGIVNSLLLLWVAHSFLHLPWEMIQTMFFLKLTVGGHMLVYLVHTEKPWYRFLPSKQVLWATSITQAIATILAVAGIFVAAITWQYALFVWVWAFFWMQVSELVKQVYAKMIGPEPVAAVQKDMQHSL